MRTEGDLIKINEWLLPLSWLYGIGVRFRNWLFDVGIKKSKAFSIPVISVGNITVGGSGKTPHVEYLIRLLQDKMQIAVLSRGYKRKSKGYVLADKDTTMHEIGDEPFQMHMKFPNIHVAVDAKRVRGIENLQSEEASKDTDVILLDDAFQHRYVKPGINILLVDYHRLTKRKKPCRHRDYHQVPQRLESDGIQSVDKGYGPLSFPTTLFHVHQLRRSERCVLGQRTDRSERLSCLAADRHRLSQADGARPQTDGEEHDLLNLWRPPPFQRKGHRPHQRDL